MHWPTLYGPLSILSLSQFFGPYRTITYLPPLTFLPSMTTILSRLRLVLIITAGSTEIILPTENIFRRFIFVFLHISHLIICLKKQNQKQKQRTNKKHNREIQGNYCRNTLIQVDLQTSMQTWMHAKFWTTEEQQYGRNTWMWKTDRDERWPTCSEFGENRSMMT